MLKFNFDCGSNQSKEETNLNTSYVKVQSTQPKFKELYGYTFKYILC